MAPLESVEVNSDRSRTLISIVGCSTIGLAVLMVILPRYWPQSAASTTGTLLLLAGLAELVVGANASKWSRGLVLTTGSLTTAAACIVLVVGPSRFFTLAAIVAAWLLARALVLLMTAFRAPWRVARVWLLWSGIANALLAVLALLIVAPVTLVYVLFGPWPRLAAYSAIPALSIFFNGVSFAAAAVAPRADSRM